MSVGAGAGVEAVGGGDVDADEGAAEPSGDAGGAADELFAAAGAGDGDDDPFAGFPGVGDAVGVHVAVEAFLDPVGDPEQGELAEGGEVAGAEVVGEGGVDALRRVDVAVGHAAAERLGAHVDELDLVGVADDVRRARSRVAGCR